MEQFIATETLVIELVLVAALVSGGLDYVTSVATSIGGIVLRSAM